MSLLNPRARNEFLESNKKRIVKTSLLKGFVYASWALLALSQTGWFVGRLEHPSDSEVQEAMKSDLAYQKEIASNYTRTTGFPQKQHISFDIFEEDQRRWLRTATNDLLNNEALQTELLKRFHTNFREVNAVIVPSWLTYRQDNNELVGISPVAWPSVEKACGQLSAKGFTIRDRAIYRQKLGVLTLDGSPRILLNMTAFDSPRVLRSTLFHELFHAMNVQRYIRYDDFRSLLYNDLTYLKDYRELELKYEPKATWDIYLWPVGIILPASFLVWLPFSVRRQINKSISKDYSQ